MITIENLSHGILSIPYFEIPEGITSVFGRNGAGKTTLLSLCAGVLLPDKGLVRIDEKSPRTLDIGWVSEFPDRNILFDEVFNEIAAPLRFRHNPIDQIEERTGEIAEVLQITHLLHRKTRSLSGGEKILVCLACALVTDPILLVIDEADSHLDRETARRVQEAIRTVSPRHVLQSSQYRDNASHSDQVVILENGQISWEGI
ncbi:ATP-binding cassette domain-containing protein [Methanocalculus taiwanensis]|uniref:ATP-binding cassette domain-containing protein n=1 Tax=Methanocalculus taiwanensis TaxID=106207 RepID=A0ABD4THG4_9EURY|nr:ATP-binding cassette domain-containing protein [Methanocalculus taiwanensis]MCQ1537654.1 ATP-binding cassette domain-containing protein [Methanocalculus taiwanensis]